MKLKKTSLATALVAALAMGAAGQASASVYAGSSLDVSNLVIGFVNQNTGAVITNLSPNFTFNVEDSATLNGSTQAFAASCSSLLGNCSAVSPVLAVNAANAPGSSLTRANNDYTLLGQGNGTYANSNAEITTAQLVNGFPSESQQVAEAELLVSGAGQASSNIQSNTTWTFDFVIDTNLAVMNLSFVANPEMKADVTLIPPFTSGLAQANLTTNFTLSREGVPLVVWSPNGAGTGLLCGIGLTCTAAEGESLNITLGVGPASETAQHSLGTPGTNFSLSVEGLTEGRYSLTLAALTSVNVTQVPEPGTLVLLGGALAALGVGGLRRRREEKVAA